jgi:MFS family permease
MNAEGAAIERGGATSTQLFLLVVASSVFITVLTATMINVLIPVMRAEFAASAAQIGWVVTGYALAYAIGVPLYGRVSDLFGVRRVFALGLLGFAAGGLICALAPSLAVLVAGRIVQGIGGAAVPALASVAVAKVQSHPEEVAMTAAGRTPPMTTNRRLHSTWTAICSSPRADLRHRSAAMWYT